MQVIEKSREDWLRKAMGVYFERVFKQHGYKLPQVRISVGLPYGRGGKKAIGQHWSPKASIDNKGSIFISPTIDGSVEVLATLAHELVHAAIGNEKGHGPEFKECAVKIGLEGKMRATVASAKLQETLKDLIKRIGKYPHRRLNLEMHPIKKQTTRMIKMECVNCEYIARASRKVIEAHGPAICPGCEHQMSLG